MCYKEQNNVEKKKKTYLLKMRSKRFRSITHVSYVTVSHLAKFNLKVLSSFVCNQSQSSPSRLIILVPLWFIIIFLASFYRSKL